MKMAQNTQNARSTSSIIRVAQKAGKLNENSLFRNQFEKELVACLISLEAFQARKVEPSNKAALWASERGLDIWGSEVPLWNVLSMHKNNG